MEIAVTKELIVKKRVCAIFVSSVWKNRILLGLQSNRNEFTHNINGNSLWALQVYNDPILKWWVMPSHIFLFEITNHISTLWFTLVCLLDSFGIVYWSKCGVCM